VWFLAGDGGYRISLAYSLCRIRTLNPNGDRTIWNCLGYAYWEPSIVEAAASLLKAIVTRNPKAMI
jgi:hypothetical protein